jgi:hypothetical protein
MVIWQPGPQAPKDLKMEKSYWNSIARLTFGVWSILREQYLTEIMQVHHK